MKKLCLLVLIGAWICETSPAQEYVSFPTDAAHWNCLFWHQWEPNHSELTNYQYLQQGDTLLKGRNYKKIYLQTLDVPEPAVYIGGLREDAERQIFFFPASIALPTPGPHTFPTDTSEQLLYSFHELGIGTVLPINAGNVSITVTGIDSVLLGNDYRKRYEIQGSLLFGPEFWIEGIGSTKDLLSPFTYEFEWQYFTLCFGDDNTYFINSPDGNDSCHYSIHTGMVENESYRIKVYPNPATDFLSIETPFLGRTVNMSLYSTEGKLLAAKEFFPPQTLLDIGNLKPGLYYLKMNDGNHSVVTRFIKK